MNELPACRGVDGVSSRFMTWGSSGPPATEFRAVDISGDHKCDAPSRTGMRLEVVSPAQRNMPAVGAMDHAVIKTEGEPIEETPGFVEEEEELKSIIEENQEEVGPDVSDSAAETETQETTEANAVVDEVPIPAASAEAVVSRTIPITLDDETIELAILEGQSPEDAVVVFCRANVAEDVSGCIRQLLPTVLERLE
eukprot:gene2089-2487_t